MIRQLKHSKQRDALIELLKSVKNHPTAEWLYSELKKDYPNLSLATVYRNLKLLADMGEIISIDIGDGVEHFDAVVDDHYHFICRECRSLSDIELLSADNLKSQAEELNKIKVEKSSFVFYGLCKKCNQIN